MTVEVYLESVFLSTASDDAIGSHTQRAGLPQGASGSLQNHWLVILQSVKVESQGKTKGLFQTEEDRGIRTKCKG